MNPSETTKHTMERETHRIRWSSDTVVDAASTLSSGCYADSEIQQQKRVEIKFSPTAVMVWTTEAKGGAATQCEKAMKQADHSGRISRGQLVCLRMDRWWVPIECRQTSIKIIWGKEKGGWTVHKWFLRVFSQGRPSIEETMSLYTCLQHKY